MEKHLLDKPGAFSLPFGCFCHKRALSVQYAQHAAECLKDKALMAHMLTF